MAKVTKTNTSCIVDSGRLIVEFENLEFTQALPSRKNVKIYRDVQKALATDIETIKTIKYQAELENATEERKEELNKLIRECAEKLNKKYDSANGLDDLILATFEGTKFKKGGFKVDGKDDEFTKDDFDEIPQIVYDQLTTHAFNLMTVQDDEEKN